VNVKFLNPFVDAATEVLKVECELVTERGDLTLHKSAHTSDDITVLISMVGQIQGVVMYSLSQETGLDMVSRVMGQKFTTFDNLAQSGVAELGNVISGRATVKFSQSGYTSNISPPTLILGQGVSISTLDFARVVVPLSTESGILSVHLALRESPPGMHDSNFVPVTIPAKL
jgi:chemotaxis protein CheX